MFTPEKNKAVDDVPKEEVLQFLYDITKGWFPEQCFSTSCLKSVESNRIRGWTFYIADNSPDRLETQITVSQNNSKVNFARYNTFKCKTLFVAV